MLGLLSKVDQHQAATSTGSGRVPTISSSLSGGSGIGLQSAGSVSSSAATSINAYSSYDSKRVSHSTNSNNIKRGSIINSKISDDRINFRRLLSRCENILSSSHPPIKDNVRPMLPKVSTSYNFSHQVDGDDISDDAIDHHHMYVCIWCAHQMLLLSVEW
jgi:hypothetical protein